MNSTRKDSSWEALVVGLSGHCQWGWTGHTFCQTQIPLELVPVCQMGSLGWVVPIGVEVVAQTTILIGYIPAAVFECLPTVMSNQPRYRGYRKTHHTTQGPLGGQPTQGSLLQVGYLKAEGTVS